MFSHDYYKEMGLQSPEKRVSKFTAALIFAVFGGALYFGYQRYMPEMETFLANRPPEIVVVPAHEASKAAVQQSAKVQTAKNGK
jgi:hypothetical protein